MTTINGGISAVSKVIFWPNKTMVPKLQITPITTTDKLSKVAEIDLKNKNKVIFGKINHKIIIKREIHKIFFKTIFKIFKISQISLF